MRLERSALVDGGFLLLLGAIASVGFSDTFHGASYLVAALLGLVLGIALAHLSNVLARPVVLLAVFTIAAFFLLGGAVALHSNGVTAMLPLPHTLRQLAEASVHGWKDLLTTLAPVDNGPLLTLPYLMALVTGAAGMALASRTRSIAGPLIAPAAYLGGVILLGIQTPSRIAILGAVFGVVAVGWMAVRAARLRARTVRGRAWSRRALAVMLVAAAGALATVVGPRLPGMGHERIVLRSYVSPPFTVGQYPSPLVGFRKYTKGYEPPSKKPDDHYYELPILKVTGLPSGTMLRFAALDAYDGDVWKASDQSPGTTGAAGAFQRVGSVIRQDAPGKRYTAHVTLERPYQGQVWLPTAGALTKLDFTDGEAKEQAAQFRYNLATQTGIVPGSLRAGDSYTFSADVAKTIVSTSTVPSDSGQATLRTGNADFASAAIRWAGDKGGSSIQQVLAVAAYMKAHGTYTDGENPNGGYVAGHAINRLLGFVGEGQQAAGDDEQYAATMALLANELGVPARAVVGAVVPSGGVVKGADVHAWVELRDEGGQWETLPTGAFMSTTTPPQTQQPQPETAVAGTAVPPPAPVRPPSSSGDPLDSTINHRQKQTHHSHLVHVPGWFTALLKWTGPPLLLGALVIALIIGAKELRRRRRRSRGAPAHRLAAAWRDLVDHARDFGHTVVSHSTRREQAGLIGVDGFTQLARDADRHVFGAADPTDADAASYWHEVDRMRAELTHSRTPWQRVKAALSLRSFRTPSKELPA